MKTKATLESDVDGTKDGTAVTAPASAPGLTAGSEDLEGDEDHGDMHQLDIGGFDVFLPRCFQDQPHTIKAGITPVAYIYVEQDPLDANVKIEHWALLDAYDPIPGSGVNNDPEKP